MKKTLFLASAMLIVGAVLILGLRNSIYKSPSIENSTVNLPEVSKSTNTEEFTASFEIYTNGTKRIFTQTMYHNQSNEVYIENPDPSVIYVKKPGITWDNFFKTLPFSLTKERLITGTKQEFCNTESKKLNFILNDQNSPNALDLEIKKDDKLTVTYGE